MAVVLSNYFIQYGSNLTFNATPINNQINIMFNTKLEIFATIYNIKHFVVWWKTSKVAITKSFLRLQQTEISDYNEFFLL